MGPIFASCVPRLQFPHWILPRNPARWRSPKIRWLSRNWLLCPRSRLEPPHSPVSDLIRNNQMFKKFSDNVYSTSNNQFYKLSCMPLGAKRHPGYAGDRQNAKLAASSFSPTRQDFTVRTFLHSVFLCLNTKKCCDALSDDILLSIVRPRDSLSWHMPRNVKW
jgi:hypothetical protein